MKRVKFSKELESIKPISKPEQYLISFPEGNIKRWIGKFVFDNKELYLDFGQYAYDYFRNWLYENNITPPSNSDKFIAENIKDILINDLNDLNVSAPFSIEKAYEDYDIYIEYREIDCFVCEILQN